MRIFYLTTAQDSDSFKNNLSKWKVSPNLSNQNFHNKLIRSIALTHDVEAISIRPINSNFSEKIMQKASKIENKVKWNYIKVSSNRIDKLLFINKRIDELSRSITSDDVLFVDTLNLTLLKQAKRIVKKRKCKLISICTDNPFNISFISDSYKENLLSLGKEANSFVALTQKINELYNPDNKPSIIIDGVTESNDFGPFDFKIDKPYIFFGGSLMRKYGVYNLIEAFNNLKNIDIELIICGHHEEADLKDNIKDKNIKYLGALSYEEVNYLEKHALCAVNPRPIDPVIDEYSIPSKTLEYLANGVLTITVKNDLLMERYGKAILWSNSGEVKDLEAALKQALNMSEKEKEQLISNALSSIQRYASLESVNAEISKLL